MFSYNMIGWLWMIMTIAINNVYIISGDPGHHPRRLSRSCEARNVDNPCLNGGQCHVTLSARDAAEPALVTCRCQPAWTGATCELEQDPCTDGSAICGPGWSCVRNSSNTAAGYDCGCGGRSGWRRLQDGVPRCVDVDECSLLLPACYNGGRCFNKAGTFNCVCKPGFRGRRCDQADGSDGWTNWGLWSPCSSRCGPGSRSRSRLCVDCQQQEEQQQEEQQQLQPCQGPCWAGQPRPYTEPPPTARPRHRRPTEAVRHRRSPDLEPVARNTQRETRGVHTPDIAEARARGPGGQRVVDRVKRDVLEGWDGMATSSQDGLQLSSQDGMGETKRGLDQPGAATADLEPDPDDADEAAVRALEADGRQVDSELSAFEHMADKMATLARDLASRAGAVVGRLGHEHEELLRNITNSSSVQQARRRVSSAHSATAAARRSAANQSAHLEELQQQNHQVKKALKKAEAAAVRWRRLEEELDREAVKAEHQLPREEARTREVALPSQAAARERSEERERLETAAQKLEALLRTQKATTEQLLRQAAAAARRERQARRKAVQLAERRRRVVLEQVASRRSYAELSEQRLGEARRRAQQALLRADASVGDQQEMLVKAAAAATQSPEHRWRPPPLPPPLPPPPPAFLKLRVMLPNAEEQAEQKRVKDKMKIAL